MSELAYQYTGLNVGVRDRVLWVGSHAYPLHNLSRVYPRSFVLETRRNAIKTAVWQCLLTVVGVSLLQILLNIPFINSVLGLAGLGLIVYLIIQAFRNSVPVTLNQLVIETTGGQGIVLNGRDRHGLIELQSRITEAINDPDANFSLTVYAHVGDNITQNGNHNVGKVGW